MLLTSSQVSIAASSSVVVVFTTALFLSGYAIQQRTLREIREAIKPSARAKPQIFLPDRFKTTTTELSDGTVIVVDVDPGPDAHRPPRPEREEQVVIEVRPTVSGEGTGGGDDENGGSERAGLSDAAAASEEGGLVEQPLDGERRRERGGRKEGKTKAKTQKKLSRAERRKQIKEEIQRLAQGNRRGVWEPRLW